MTTLRYPAENSVSDVAVLLVLYRHDGRATAEQIKAAIGTRRSIGTALNTMRKYGVVAEHGKYVLPRHLITWFAKQDEVNSGLVRPQYTNNFGPELSTDRAVRARMGCA